MRSAVRVALLLMLAGFGATAFAQHAPQQAGSQPLEPALEARVQAVGKQLRCVVCQGMSIADSPASMARAQMDVVRALVQQGKSDQEIKDYFVARYGEFALLQPTTEGSNLFLWVGPGIFLVLGLGFIVLYSAQHSAKKKAGTEKTASSAEAAPANPGPAPAGEGAAPEDPYLSAVRAELEK